MSIRFADSWDHYSTAELIPSKKWHNRRLSTGSTIIAGGRFSSNLFDLTIWTGDSRLIVHFDSQATWIVGFAFKINKGNPLQGPMRPVSFLDNDALQCYLQIGKDSLLRFYNGNNVLLATSTKPYPQDNFQFVEIKVTFHSSAGTVQVRVNEETVINATSQATQVTGVNTADGICLGPTSTTFDGSSGNNDGFFDDFYVCDTLGAQHTNFLGDVHIEAIVPNATGGSSQFAPVGTTPNYTNVDESSAPNSDTDYNLGSVIGHRDLYKFPALSIAPGQQNELTAIITNMWLRKDFAGTRTVRSVLARASGTALGTAFAFDGSYAYHLQDIFDVNPVGGTAWGHGDVNATEFGIDIVT